MMARVYEVVPDVNNYQLLLCKNAEDGQREMLRRREEAPPVYAYNPDHRAPDIWSFSPSGDLVFTPAAIDTLGPILSLAGDMLPLPFEDQVFHILDVHRVNCLDPDTTLWRGPREPPGSRRPQPALKQPAFYNDRWPEATLFKIPEARVRTYCVEGLHDPEDEFKAVVETKGLTGLTFRLVWDSEAAETPVP